MAKMQFKKATRKQLKVKVGLMGTAGTGKTWNALAIAEALGGDVAVIDSERGRAEAYAGDFEFDHLALPNYAPESYIEALSAANDAGYDVILVDSISHEWVGRDGILSSVDRFGGWKDATPRHDNFVEAIFRLPRHVIVTMRAKTQYQVSEVPRDDGRGVRQEITKLGVGPVQRDNLEYEFDLLGMMELDHSLRLHKSVIAALPSGSVLDAGDNPRALGRQLAWAIKEWVDSGEEIEKPVEAEHDMVALLVHLLHAEGFDDERIETTFRKRRLELGALTQEYVTSQIAQSQARLKQKGQEAGKITADYWDAHPAPVPSDEEIDRLAAEAAARGYTNTEEAAEQADADAQKAQETQQGSGEASTPPRLPEGVETLSDAHEAIPD